MIACNANDTVPRYLSSGTWDPHATVATLSNAMDISRPNNWPRVEALVKMQGWSLKDFDFGSLSDEETKKAMRNIYKNYGYVAEPHAAIACQCLEDNMKDGEVGIFLGTAHPAKFKAAVDEILGIDLALPEALAQKAQLESKSVLMQPEYETLKNYILKELGL